MISSVQRRGDIIGMGWGKNLLVPPPPTGSTTITGEALRLRLRVWVGIRNRSTECGFERDDEE